MSALAPRTTLTSRDQLIAAAALLVLLLVVYVVQFDQGAISRSGMFMHELMHDGRHLLGIPCH
ncbi:MAG: CbtB-domain containing protein [Solirubrobacteraceae bacterium]|nr:CbtB-domain containing protein [Solirubrobacteraceae bacterium]